MKREEVLDRVKDRLGEISGHRRSEVLDEDARREVSRRERESERLAKEEGLMPIYNEGLWATLQREVQIAMVLDEGTEIISNTSGLLQLHDQDGRMIGEWVNEARAEELREREDVQFMGQDFVLYPGAELEGQPHFILPEVDFPFLKGIQGIENVTSCSPSGLVDQYIRGSLGLEEHGLMTHIVGFDLREGQPRPPP